MGLSHFLYGVLHAAGPRHGKAVLTTYLLTHKHRLNRGVAMGAVAALLQGVTTLLLVYGLIGIADGQRHVSAGNRLLCRDLFFRGLVCNLHFTVVQFLVLGRVFRLGLLHVAGKRCTARHYQCQ